MSSPCTHLLAVLGRVHPVVQAGLVRQPEGLLEQVLGEVLEGESEDDVAHPSVLFLVMMAEVDEVLDVVVATNVLELLTKSKSEEEQIFVDCSYAVGCLHVQLINIIQ